MILSKIKYKLLNKPEFISYSDIPNVNLLNAICKEVLMVDNLLRYSEEHQHGGTTLDVIVNKDLIPCAVISDSTGFELLKSIEKGEFILPDFIDLDINELVNYGNKLVYDFYVAMRTITAANKYYSPIPEVIVNKAVYRFIVLNEIDPCKFSTEDLSLLADKYTSTARKIQGGYIETYEDALAVATVLTVAMLHISK